MAPFSRTLSLLVGVLLFSGALVFAEDSAPAGPLQISGVYPHLAMYNGAGECGIGGVVNWAGKLWVITYPPHVPKGSPDKLYEIDEKMTQVIRPESIGGTHACRLIHRESKQLIIGPYFIDEKGSVRVADISKLVGRLTAIARHISDPANLVYFYDMEGKIYEVNVHTLAVKKIFEKPVPGWHGKGAYTSQGRLVVANNGETAVDKSKHEWLAKEPPKSPEDAGVLAEFDGKDWRIIERHQFTDVTGPGGINGAPKDDSPLWSIGWDKRSVMLKLLDGGNWSTFRLPKASHAFDPKHGWYTEWPRIREIAPNQLMMTMHGMMYDFPIGFSAANTSGISPICSHLRYVTDFCNFNGRLVVSSDDASVMQNPMCGQSQSNMWFGKYEQLKEFGPKAGWGGVWLDDPVKAGVASHPFLFHGFEKRVLHLSHTAASEVQFLLEVDNKGDGNWTKCDAVTVPAKGYAFHIFPATLDAQWIRVTADKDCTATAYFHYSASGHSPKDGETLFKTLADVSDTSVVAGLIGPSKSNRNLQFAPVTVTDGKAAQPNYLEINEQLVFSTMPKSNLDEMNKVLAVKNDFEVDAASVIMTLKDKRYRLPKGAAQFDKPFAFGWPRAIREVASERFLMNIHGTFYEMPREEGLPLIRPVCSHSKQIADFCTWRGVLVLSGTKPDAKADGQFFGGEGAGLWCGAIDDLWKLGKPVGKGGPWMQTPVEMGVPSDPYLMTGFDKKTVQLSHNSTEPVEIILEVDTNHHGWQKYQTITVPVGQTVTHIFPDGYSTHWIRATPNKPCRATATFIYE